MKCWQPNKSRDKNLYYSLKVIQWNTEIIFCWDIMSGNVVDRNWNSGKNFASIFSVGISSCFFYHEGEGGIFIQDVGICQPLQNHTQKDGILIFTVVRPSYAILTYRQKKLTFPAWVHLVGNHYHEYRTYCRELDRYTDMYCWWISNVTVQGHYNERYNTKDV